MHWGLRQFNLSENQLKLSYPKFTQRQGNLIGNIHGYKRRDLHKGRDYFPTSNGSYFALENMSF